MLFKIAYHNEDAEGFRVELTIECVRIIERRKAGEAEFVLFQANGKTETMVLKDSPASVYFMETGKTVNKIRFVPNNNEMMK